MRSLGATVILCLLAASASAVTPATPAPHPLTPLNATEIAAAAKAVGGYKAFPKGALYPMIALREPSKAAMQKWKPGAKLAREASVVVLDRAANATFEAVVDLGKGAVTSWQAMAGAQPLVLVEEYDAVPKIVKADAGWQAAMKKRGITDMDKIWVDTWASGHFAPKGSEGARLLRAVAYLQEGAINFYGRPIEGVTAVVDMNQGKVVELIDTGVIPIAKASPQFDEKALGPQRKDVKPLVMTQPEGPSYKVTGNAVDWQKWQFRWGMHPREGLVLYDVRYRDGAASRPVMYRGALSEMVVPYGDTDTNWVWRNAFDEGEYGVGRLASPIEPNLDAPAGAQLFDADFSDDFGKPYVVKNAVGLYERDGGILWKYYDVYHDQNQTRRARQLVVFFIATIGNYDYAVNWIFHQDGTLEVDCALTGIMLAKGVKDTKAHPQHVGHGHLVAPNVLAPHHQHFFNFRLDLDVDGNGNSAFEMNTRAATAGPENPEGNGIVMEETALASEKAAQRDMDMGAARVWHFVQPAKAKQTALGYQPGFVLAPGGNTVPYLSKESLVRRRAPFIEHHLFVTRYKEGERHAAGEYPNQARPGGGLTLYAGDDEKLVNQDLVVWYTMGITHVPRPEEWPIMPVHHVGFRLMPAGFFTQSPALDVPR